MIVQYTIVSAKTIHDLEVQVNDLIKKTWQPQGGPFIRNEYGNVFQAMVLIKKRVESC